MLWAISGGAGFLGLHLSRRLLDDGHEVRTLDVVPLDDADLERAVDERRGDIRDPASVPDKHPIGEGDPLVGVGWYGESKIEAEALCRAAEVDTTIDRPKTFIGPERLGVFEILFDWI